MNTQMASSHIPPDERVPLRTKILWGAGGLADNFMFNVLMALGMLIYVDHFRLSPVLAGIALFVPRFIDAITDPWIGNMSDNCKSRWGRRRPFIFWGTLLSALMLPFLWTPLFPATSSNVWYANGPFLYLCITGSVLAVVYTLFVVPYTALGYELTPHYDERTRTISWRMYIGLAGSLSSGWLYKLTQMDRFPDTATGAIAVSAVASVIVLISGMMPVVGCREKIEIETQPKIRFLEAIRYTMTNRPFLILFVTYVIVVIALFATSNVVPFLLIYYVFEGDKSAFGTFQGLLMTLATLMSYGSIFLITFISTHTGKRTAMLVGIGLVFTGNLLNWWAINPMWPWAMYAAAVVAFLGMQGCWLMVDSMVADVCDADELATGRRREGMFSAVKGFALKLAQALTAAMGGFMLALAGFDPDTANTIGISADTAWNMKALFVGTTCGGLIVAAIAIWFYPITREKAQATRAMLEARKQAAQVQ